MWVWGGGGGGVGFGTTKTQTHAKPHYYSIANTIANQQAAPIARARKSLARAYNTAPGLVVTVASRLRWYIRPKWPTSVPASMKP